MKVESAIQKAVIRWVKDNYPDVIITATANERSYRETDQIGSLGIPDLILFTLDERVLFLELKRKSGSLLPSQAAWNEAFDLRRSTQFRRAVAYGFAEARAAISSFLTPAPTNTTP